jgi:hypothetical protein
MGETLEERRRYYSEPAAKLRAVAREARYPAARNALIDVAQRFEREACRANTLRVI